jgi:lariat debranching enzyme
MLSHDWPRGVYHFGDVDKLLRAKPFFKEEVLTNSLGSAPSQELLTVLQPKYWFAAHLHVKFPAIVTHTVTEEDVEKQTGITKFLALDKCLPRRHFLQVRRIKFINRVYRV